MRSGDSWFVRLACALCLAVAAIAWGTWSAAGADAYGYVTEASLLLKGHLVVDQPLARDVPWPNADWTLTPIGYRPGLEPGTIVPVYPIGLPLVMALFQAIAGPRAVFFVVPVFAAVLVVAASLLAERVSGRTAGALAAVLMATSPTVGFAAMWPMSDIPGAAWWTLALYLTTGASVTSAVAAGASAGIAVVTRPNLVGLAVPLGAYLVWRVWTERSHARPAILRLLAFTALTIAGCIAVAMVNTWLFGAPMQTGYGTVGEVFKSSYAPRTIRGFITRPVATEPALVLLAVVGLIAGVRRSANKANLFLCIGVVAVVLASYTFYLPNDEWWYLRFLLPAYPPLAVLAGAGVSRLSERLPGLWRPAIVGTLVYAVAIGAVALWVERGVAQQRAAESRYEAVARFAKEALPPGALLLASQHSASLRYYADRQTLRFDQMEPEWLERALALLSSRGYQPYLVIEDHEVEAFQNRFRRATPLGALDWPAMARYDGPIDVLIFDPRDRERLAGGASIETRSIPSVP